MPGRDRKDKTQFIKDKASLGLYAMDFLKPDTFKNSIVKKEELETYLGNTIMFLGDEVFLMVYPDAKRPLFHEEAFLKCTTFMSLRGEPMHECVKHMIDEGYFPRFEDFVKDIDDAVANGAKPKCS